MQLSLMQKLTDRGFIQIFDNVNYTVRYPSLLGNCSLSAMVTLQVNLHPKGAQIIIGASLSKPHT